MKNLHLTLVFLCVSAAALAAPGGGKPNIVFILADDLGYGEVSCYGQKRYETPQIDRLAREGMLFTDHYAGSAVCAPSRSVLMTGQHTGHTTVRHNAATTVNDFFRVPLKPSDVTIAQRLKAAGYTTAMYGKWGLGEEGSGAEPWHKGWDEFYGFLNQQHAHNQYPEFLYRNAEKEPLVRNFAHVEHIFANDLFTGEAEAFLERQKKSGKPFFLYMSYTTPHADLKCPQDSLDEARAKHPALAAPGAPANALVFAAMVLRLDRDVGRLMAKLKELGLDENTLVIFTSDNGPHDMPGKDTAYFAGAGPLRGSKTDLYEGGIRVPFIARWPGRIAPGTTSAHLSAFWDFPATALEVAGAQPGDLPADGISYLPTLLGSPQEQVTHEYLYWEFLMKRAGRQAIRQGNWKAVRDSLDAPIELYDLAKDIGERNNVAAQHPGLVKQFADLFVSARVDNPVFPLVHPEGPAGAVK